MTTDTKQLTVRAFDQTGTRELVGSFVIAAPEEDESHAAQVVDTASAVIGSPVALLGLTESNVACVEILAPAPGVWLEAQLPEGWQQRAPWRQPGWYAATTERIDAALEGAGCRRTGPAVQTKHWSISALMRVPTDVGDLWFKQVPPMFAHEGRLVAWLAELGPDVVSAPLAVGDDWWIASDLGPAVETDDPFGALEVLIELQQCCLGRSEELLAIGCPDRRLPVLMHELSALVHREDLLPEGQRSQLEAELPALAEIFSSLDQAGLPDTLAHGDFHRGNVRFTDRGWRIYDWTDGCLAHPLIDLAPSALAVEGRAMRLAAVHQLWRQSFPELTIEQAQFGLIAGAAHQVVTYQRIKDGVEADAVTLWTGSASSCASALFELLAGAPESR